jgi:hypothetical protein
MPSIKFCFRIHIGFHWLGIFVIIAQLASFFGALFWKDQKMVLQESLLVFNLLLYTSSALCWNNQLAYLFKRTMGIALLKPFQLFGLDYLNPIPHAVFWSLLFNVMSYAAISVSFKGNYRNVIMPKCL